MQNKFKIQNGVAIILLSQNKVALIDTAQLDCIANFRWCAYKHRNTYYAFTNIWVNSKRTTIDMHRMLMRLSSGDGEQVDHINGNGLDNRLKNLRLANANINQHNQHIK